MKIFILIISCIVSSIVVYMGHIDEPTIKDIYHLGQTIMVFSLTFYIYYSIVLILPNNKTDKE